MIPLPRFEDPWWLLLLFLLPVLAWLRHRQGDVGALVYSRLPEASSGAWRIHLPFYLRLLAAAALVLALARPQLGYSWEESVTEGIDIQIVLDISGSMAAEDFQPENRLTVAKQVVREFVSGRSADRMGFVIFAGNALTRAPLTTDHTMLDFLIDSVSLNSLPDGTAIGMALATATSRLRNSTAESRIIVLVTDGVNNAGEIDPLSAAAICKGLGVRVYTIGVGRQGQVPVPVTTRDPRTGQETVRRIMLNVEVDKDLLQRIADKTDGRFYEATDSEALRSVFAEIDQLEKTEIQAKRYVRYREVFQPAAWVALALLLLPLLTTTLGVTVEP